jgi:hypothetical protein
VLPTPSPPRPCPLTLHNSLNSLHLFPKKIKHNPNGTKNKKPLQQQQQQQQQQGLKQQQHNSGMNIDASAHQQQQPFDMAQLTMLLHVGLALPGVRLVTWNILAVIMRTDC